MGERPKFPHTLDRTRANAFHVKANTGATFQTMTAPHRLDPAIIDRIAAAGRTRHFEVGNMIFARGEPGESLLVLREGEAEVGVVGISGRPSIFGLVQPGDLVGDVACLDGGPRSADVTARTAVSGAMVARRDLLALLRSDPEVALAVITALCAKVRNASAMLELQTLPGARARLATAVLRLSDEAGGAERITLSQSWLGAFAGLTRENVNRQIRAFSDSGALEFKDGAVRILDREALEDAAAE